MIRGKISLSQMLIITLITLSVFRTVETAVLGIDFGSQFYKISMIRAGKKPFSMVENRYSKTKTYNGVSFYDKTRYLEYDAATKASRNTKNAFVNLLKFFGRQPSDESLASMSASQYENNQIHTLEEDKAGFYFKLDNFTLPEKGGSKDRPLRLSQEATILRLEEVVAMVLEHAKSISDAFGNTSFSDVFFTIPPWWTPVERETLYSSARLAGFNPIGYMSENTGAAIFKGMERKEEDEDLTILFYNMGSSSTKVSLVKYTKVENPTTKKMEDKITLLGETWDATLGGYGMDWCVAEMFAEAFDAKFGTSIKENHKVMRRMLKTANKVKEMLSANKEAMMIVEEVYNDKDFTLKISREQFEERCKPLFDRVKAPVAEIFAKTEISPSDIDFVEILGGAVRVPRVRTLLEEATTKPSGMHMNGDDSMAMGASFAAANSTSTFKAKKLILEHGPTYEVMVDILDLETVGTDAEYKKNATLFPKGHNYGSRKKLNLNHASNLQVNLTVPVENGEDYVLNYDISGVKAILEDEKNENATNGRIELGFTLDFLGIPYIHSANLLLDKEVTVESTKPDEESAESSSSSEEKETSSDQKTKTRTIVKDLKVEQVSTSGGSTFLKDSDAIKESNIILGAFRDYEEYTNKISESKNRLEGLIYKVQDLLEEESFTKFATEEEKELMKQKAEETDEWLFSSEVKDADFKILNSKYKEFYKTVKHVEKRKDEAYRRPQQLSDAHKKLDKIESTISSIQKSRKWVSDEQVKEALEELELNRKWLEDKVVEQTQRDPSMEPIMSISDIKSRVKNSQELIYKLRKIPQPKKSKDEEAASEEDGPTIDAENVDLDAETLEKIKESLKNKAQGENDPQIKELLEQMQRDQKAKEEAKEEAKGEATEEASSEEETDDQEQEEAASKDEKRADL